MKIIKKILLGLVILVGAVYLSGITYHVDAIGTQTVPIPATSSYILVSSSTGATSSNGYILVQMPDCSNSTTSKLYYNSSTKTFYCGTDQTGVSISFPLPYTSSTHGTIIGTTYLNATTDANGSSTLTNLGVQTITAGSGISVSVATGTPTIANSGVLSLSNGGGILFDKSTGTITATNIGVTSLSGSSTIGVSNATGTVKIGAQYYPIQWIIENPTASENDSIFIFRSTSTVNSCYAVNKTNGDTVTFGLGYSTSRATATSSLFQLFTSAQTVTATTTPATLTINGSSTPGSINTLRFWTTAASSTQFTMSCFYTES